MAKLDFKIYNTTAKLPNQWDALPTGDIFLKTQFLSALECSCPKNIKPYYVGFFNLNKLVGIAIIQRVEMYYDDIFRDTSDVYIKQRAKQLVAKIVKGNALIIGNLMHTGQHGLWFDNEKTCYQDYLNTLDQAIISIKNTVKKDHNKKIRIIGFKDYFEEDAINKNQDFFKKHKLYKVQVQPNMVFNIPEQWRSVDDYILSFKKKYRDRYKSARKKANAIVKRELSLEEIKNLEPILFKLYKTVSDNAGVNSFVLCDTHFSHLKEELKENFKVFAYFLNEELVGFYTLITNNSALETYFLGYNKALQQKHQLYLNMLYDMASYAIENKFSCVIYARTAIEIKSSVGAKAKTMHIYMKHTNFIANTMLKFIVKYLNPIKAWEERHPFKT